ncbi:unnamed protein product [Rangifer tarandus platyrhynchus]|uniref:Uncharacterized protein n=2 Tax=Rangifer tarandus platyrhynchus TaxID=3082113 RepID=A0ACB0DZH5_RANTA|nr:unnamed protein product [Rangifer tarandus platyrhynchus]CAI9693680.1 unnamed protein product [Rangifer tarandus platyrhynchus]
MWPFWPRCDDPIRCQLSTLHSALKCGQTHVTDRRCDRAERICLRLRADPLPELSPAVRTFCDSTLLQPQADRGAPSQGSERGSACPSRSRSLGHGRKRGAARVAWRVAELSAALPQPRAGGVLHAEWRNSRQTLSKRAGPAVPKSSSQMYPRVGLALRACLRFLPSPKGLELQQPRLLIRGHGGVTPDVPLRSQGRPPPTPKPALSCGPSPGPPPAAPTAGSPLLTEAFLPPPPQVRRLQPLFLEPQGRPLGRPSAPRPARQAGTAVTSVSGAWKRIWEEMALFAKGHEDADLHSAEKTRSVSPVLSTASCLSCQQLARSLGSADPQLQTASQSHS